MTLAAPKGEVGVGAHLGFRVLYRQLLATLGGRVATIAPDAPASVSGRTIVHGNAQIATLGSASESDWAYPYAIFGRADAYLDEAYEPGHMIAAVYAAVDLALGA